MTVAQPSEPELDPLFEGLVRTTLARQGLADWQLKAGDFWCHVRPSGAQLRQQGWKLHLSATPLSAPLVLARSIEVLLRYRCAFKFAGTLARVEELVAPRYDRGGGGKFITVYPDLDDRRLGLLAEELHRATEGLPGPGILSDRRYRPGSLVHYRFGVFTGTPVLGNDGSYEAMLVDPSGALVLDQRKAWFSLPAWAPRDPFQPSPDSAQPDSGTTKVPDAVLLNDRYAVRGAIRHAVKGGVYRAVDTSTGAGVIVKQARAYVGATATGWDVRDLLRHEAAMLELFEDSGLTPRPVDLFEQQGDLFLVQEEVAGTTLDQWVPANLEHDADGHWGTPRESALQIARDLAELVDEVHGRGLTLRDFTPKNVMVTADGAVRLIDLEMFVRPGDRVYRAYTPGYAPPEQVGAPRFGPAPGQQADLFGLGATLFYLASGVQPFWPSDGPVVRTARERIEASLELLAQGNLLARQLTPLITELMAADPRQRPALDDVRRRLGLLTSEPAPPPPGPPDEYDGAQADGVAHLIATMEPDNAERLWPVSSTHRRTDPFNVQYGAAGVLATLTRVLGTEQTPQVRESVATAADWIRRGVPREPRLLPGLQFGRSGTAWALLDAGRALDDQELVTVAVELAGRIPMSWPNPDVCHGLAGAGLTQLHFFEQTGDSDFLVRAKQTADGLVAAAERHDGLVSWPIPLGFASGLAGLVHYGFAHGVAGIGAFLLAAGRVTGDATYLATAAEAADTLVSLAEVEDGAAFWRTGEVGGPRMTYWCSGSSGVATFLSRVWQDSGDDKLLDLVRQAATAVHRSRWHTGSSQCHGLAGDGELLLDLDQILDEPQYLDWAEDLAAAIHLKHAVREGRQLAPDETGTEVSVAFGTGLAGVVAFQHRLRHGGPRLWLPEALSTHRRTESGG
jgi:serine/threonine protein kinase